MNKRSISKKFNDAEIGVWTPIIDEEVRLTDASFSPDSEVEAEINKHIAAYIQKSLSAAVQKKIIGLKAVVSWPYDGSNLRPVVNKIEVFRISGKKYILLMRIGHSITV
jgi:hypothetical protein